LAPRSGAYGADETLPGLERASRAALLASCASLALTVATHACGAAWPDSIGAFALAAFALRSIVWPVLEGCAAILLQASPAHLRDSLSMGVRALSALDGVLEVKECRFWAVGPADCVASLHVRLRSSASEEAVAASARAQFGALVTSLTIEIDRDEWLM